MYYSRSKIVSRVMKRFCAVLNSCKLQKHCEALQGHILFFRLRLLSLVYIELHERDFSECHWLNCIELWWRIHRLLAKYSTCHVGSSYLRLDIMLSYEAPVYWWCRVVWLLHTGVQVGSSWTSFLPKWGGSEACPGL